jgi:hypothetical protein
MFTREDIDMLNTRVITTTNKPPVGAVVACPQNNLRAMVNNEVFTTYNSNHPAVLEDQNPFPSPDAWRTRGALTIIGSITKSGKSTDIDPELVPFIQNMTWTDLDGTLNLVLGGPMVTTFNYLVGGGIANGTEATLQDIILKNDATIKFDPQRGVHVVDISSVKCLILRHHNETWLKSSLFSSLPPGCFAVTPRTTSRSIHIRGKMFTVNIKQISAMPFIGTTDHKLQGKTLAALVVADPGTVHKDGKTGWLYVALSRVRTLATLYLAQPLSTNMSTYRPRILIMAEMNRLKQLATRTLEIVADAFK